MECKTSRLCLRTLTMNDADDIFEYAQSPNVGPYAGWKPHASIEETHEVMKRVFINQKNVWYSVINQWESYWNNWIYARFKTKK